MSARGPFVKLFRNLWDGTLGRQPAAWTVFIFMLAHCDAEGIVDMTPDAIAARSGLDLEAVKRGIEVLEASDSESRSPGEDGARIVRVEDHRSWGWRITNYRAHRSRTSAQREADRRQRQGEEYRQRNRDRMRAIRARKGETA